MLLCVLVVCTGGHPRRRQRAGVVRTASLRTCHELQLERARGLSPALSMCLAELLLTPATTRTCLLQVRKSVTTRVRFLPVLVAALASTRLASGLAPSASDAARRRRRHAGRVRDASRCGAGRVRTSGRGVCERERGGPRRRRPQLPPRPRRARKQVKNKSRARALACVR